MKLTGKAIKERNPAHKELNDNREYEYTEYSNDGKGKIKSIAVIVPTNEELQLEEDNKRADELRQIIADKKLLDMNCKKEQNELKKLLGY